MKLFTAHAELQISDAMQYELRLVTDKVTTCDIISSRLDRWYEHPLARDSILYGSYAHFCQ